MQTAIDDDLGRRVPVDMPEHRYGYIPTQGCSLENDRRKHRKPVEASELD